MAELGVKKIKKFSFIFKLIEYILTCKQKEIKEDLELAISEAQR